MTHTTLCAPTRGSRKHRRLATLAAATVALATAFTLTTAPATAGGRDGASSKASYAGPHRPHPGKPAHKVQVMTRNLYLGASLTTIIDALSTGDQATIVGAATQTWNQVQGSAPAARMGAVADEIVRARPDVVGLQEVTRWTTYPVDPATGQVTGGPTVAYDFLQLLLDALAARGAQYTVVADATANNFASPPIPVVTAGGLDTAVALTDRDVILKRAGVVTKNATNGNFDTVLGPPEVPIEVARGWGSVDVQARKARFRFVNTHLEAWGPEAIRVAQVAELRAAQNQVAAAHGWLPAVWVGDFNSEAPDGAAYQSLTGFLADSWVRARGSAPGYTSGQAALLNNPTSQLDVRIDLVLTSPKVRTKRAFLTGDTPVDLPGDVWWASDHAGVVAQLLLPPRRHR